MKLNAAEMRAFLSDVETASAHAALDVVGAWMLALPRYMKRHLLSAICGIVGAIRDGGGDLSGKPQDVRCSTSPEAAAATIFLCDLATRANFSLDVEGMSIVHRRPNSPHQMILRCPDFDRFEDADMSEADRKVRLMDLLAHYPGGRDSVLVVAYALGRLLADDHGRVDLTLGELLRMDGVITDRSGASKREQWDRALMYHAAFRAIRDWEVWGNRSWRQDGHEEAVLSQTQLFNYDGRSYPEGQDPLPGMVGIPYGFTLRDSDLSERLRATSRGQQADGLLALAQLPRHRLQGDWAASIGLAAMFYVRVEGSRNGGTIRKSRRNLLNRYVPNTPAEALLQSDTPQRAVKAMDAALDQLSKIGLIQAT